MTSDRSGNTELVVAMPRRGFLKGLLGGSLAVVAGGAFLLRTAPASAQSSAQAPTPKRRLRGTRDGLVQESLDGGQTWQTVAKFGSSCAIVRLVEAKGQIYAYVSYKRRSFRLRSADARVWRTT